MLIVWWAGASEYSAEKARDMTNAVKDTFEAARQKSQEMKDSAGGQRRDAELWSDYDFHHVMYTSSYATRLSNSTRKKMFCINTESVCLCNIA